MDGKKDTERRLIAVFENSLKIKLLLFNILICMTSKLELVSVMFRVYLLIKKKTTRCNTFFCLSTLSLTHQFGGLNLLLCSAQEILCPRRVTNEQWNNPINCRFLNYFQSSCSLAIIILLFVELSKLTHIKHTHHMQVLIHLINQFCASQPRVQ